MPKLADTIVALPTQLGIHTTRIKQAAITAAHAANHRILYASNIREATRETDQTYQEIVQRIGLLLHLDQ